MVTTLGSRGRTGTSGTWPEPKDKNIPTLAQANVGSIVKLFVESDDLMRTSVSLPFHFLTVYYSFRGISDEYKATALEDGDVAICDKDNEMLSIVLEKKPLHRTNSYAVKLFAFDCQKTIWVHETVLANIISKGFPV